MIQVSVTRNFRNLNLNERRNVRRALESGANLARELTPVRTGEMKRGWRVSGHSLRNDVRHAAFIDQGTRFIRPRRISVQAARRIEDELVNRSTWIEVL